MKIWTLFVILLATANGCVMTYTRTEYSDKHVDSKRIIKPTGPYQYSIVKNRVNNPFEDNVIVEFRRHKLCTVKTKKTIDRTEVTIREVASVGHNKVIIPTLYIAGVITTVQNRFFWDSIFPQASP